MSFLSLPQNRSDTKTAKYLVLPIPYEGTVCFLSGTSRGPDAILEVSNQMEHFDEELLIDFTKDGIATLKPIPPADTPAEQFERIYSTVKKHDIFSPQKFPIILGGEHSITPPIVKAASERYENLSVLQFDAHADLRDEYNSGGKFSHASAMRRVIEITPHLVQVGIRSFSEEEYLECPKIIQRIITPRKLAQNFEQALEEIISNLTEKVYITFDIDAFDPAFAPGTGTPEPGGLDWLTVTGILRKVFACKKVIGADIVEVAPLDNSHNNSRDTGNTKNVITEFLAARLAAKIIALDTGS